MIRDIFVISMCVVAVGAGIWCWWVDRHGSESSDTTSEIDSDLSKANTSKHTTEK